MFGIGKKKRKRASRDVDIAKARAAFARVDKLLSDAQHIIGRELSHTALREEHPKAFSAADQGFRLIERARHRLRKRS